MYISVGIKFNVMIMYEIFKSSTVLSRTHRCSYLHFLTSLKNLCIKQCNHRLFIYVFVNLFTILLYISPFVVIIVACCSVGLGSSQYVCSHWNA